MGESEAGGVQELAAQARLGGAVHGVAGDRQADRSKVHPDLVGASGFEADAQQRVRRQQLQHLEVRDCVLRRIRVE